MMRTLSILCLLLSASLATNLYQWQTKRLDNATLADMDRRLDFKNGANKTMASALIVTTIQRDHCRNLYYKNARGPLFSLRNES